MGPPEAPRERGRGQGAPGLATRAPRDPGRPANRRLGVRGAPDPRALLVLSRTGGDSWGARPAPARLLVAGPALLALRKHVTVDLEGRASGALPGEVWIAVTSPGGH